MPHHPEFTVRDLSTTKAKCSGKGKRGSSMLKVQSRDFKRLGTTKVASKAFGISVALSLDLMTGVCFVQPTPSIGDTMDWELTPPPQVPGLAKVTDLLARFSLSDATQHTQSVQPSAAPTALPTPPPSLPGPSFPVPGPSSQVPGFSTPAPIPILSPVPMPAAASKPGKGKKRRPN